MPIPPTNQFKGEVLMEKLRLDFILTPGRKWGPGIFALFHVLLGPGQQSGKKKGNDNIAFANVMCLAC